MSVWKAIETRLGARFILWATADGDWSRYAVVHQTPPFHGGLKWRRYNSLGETIDESGGCFYDTNDSEDHPEGAVEWARRAATKAAEKAARLLATE